LETDLFFSGCKLTDFDRTYRLSEREKQLTYIPGIRLGYTEIDENGVWYEYDLKGNLIS